MKGNIKHVPKSSKPKDLGRTKTTRKGAKHENKASRKRDNVNENRPPTKTTLVLDESSSSQKKPQFKKFKKKSEMKRKSKDLSASDVGGKVKELIEDRGSLSNWETFLKEAKEGTSKSQQSKKEKFQSKKKVGAEDGSRKRKFENKGRETNAKKSKQEHTKELGNGSIKKADIWFDDVDLEDIENATGQKIEVAPVINKSTLLPQVNDVDKATEVTRITKRLGIDCEMVGVGIDGKDSMLARVSIVNSLGEAVYDKFVAPMQKVVDYRTEFSGVRPEDLVKAPTFKQVQSEVAQITNEKLLIGHAIHNDLKVLLLSHPRKSIRDTSTYKPFKKLLKTRFPSLKKLAKEVLNVDIQSGEHSSVEDARCAMKIYQLHKKNWEKSLKDKGYKTIIDNAPTIFMGKNSGDIKKRYRDRRDAREKRKKKAS